MLAVLLRHHADVNARTTFEQLTPLHVAVKHKHTTVALQLIDHGADVSIVDAVLKWKPFSKSLLYFATM